MSTPEIAVTAPDHQEIGLTDRMTNALIHGFDLVIQSRETFFTENPNLVPNTSNIPAIIDGYARKNMMVSGVIGCVPGPWGMAASIPEIATLVRNQCAMIYDIGIAYGKQHYMTKELMAGVLLSGFGASGGGLLLVHGSEILVRRVSLRVFQKVVQILGGKVLQQVVKSAVSKWLPIVGAAAMAAWSNYSTRLIGKKAVELLQMQIHETDPAEDFEQTLSFAEKQAAPDLLSTKIRILINLMLADKQIKPTELEYINELIARTPITESEREALRLLVQAGDHQAVTLTAFLNDADAAVALLIDMVGLAYCDGDLHVTERLYIKQIGSVLGFSDTDVQDLLSTRPLDSTSSVDAPEGATSCPSGAEASV